MSKLETTQKTEAVNLREWVSIRQAATILGVNRTWLSGYLKGINVELIRFGPTLGVRRSDLKRVELPRRKKA